MKLNLLASDYTRLYIVGRKITPKHLNTPELAFAKVSYYLYLFEYYRFKREFTDCRQCLEHVFDTL
jgi:hypothetical protein